MPRRERRTPGASFIAGPGPVPTACSSGARPALLRQSGHGSVALLHQFPAACHADILIGDLFSQRIAVYAQKIGAAGLVAARGIQRNLDQGSLDLAQNALVKARWR